VRPQLLVTVDLHSLLGPGGLGGEAGGGWPLDPETCRRLACDGAVTRVLVTRDPTHPTLPDPGDDPGGDGSLAGRDPSGMGGLGAHDHPGTAPSLAAHLQAAATRLPATLGGAPTQPLEVGRTSRVVTAAQRVALVVRDRGCAFSGCDRPPAWCEAHHLVHWLHGGPTDLANLALLCRGHHRAVHEGGWRLGRDPDGRLVATPPHRQHRRQPAVV
jgi:HNH endonuclease